MGQYIQLIMVYLIMAMLVYLLQEMLKLGLQLTLQQLQILIIFRSLTLNDTKLENPTFEVVKGNNVVNAYFVEEIEEQPPIVTGNEPISMDLPEGEIVPGQGSVLKTNYTLVDAETYYKDIDFSASKDLLEESLRTLVSNHKLVSYGDARYTMLYTEESITTPGKILGLYDSKLFEPEWDKGTTFNREHVWCRSHLKIEGKDISTNNSTKGIGSDLHNLKPLTSSLNSSRGDDFLETMRMVKIIFILIIVEMLTIEAMLREFVLYGFKI